MMVRLSSSKEMKEAITVSGLIVTETIGYVPSMIGGSCQKFSVYSGCTVSGDGSYSKLAIIDSGSATSSVSGVGSSVMFVVTSMVILSTFSALFTELFSSNDSMIRSWVPVSSPDVSMVKIDS